MNLNKKGIVGISLCAALALQALGEENSLGTVDVISTEQDKESYTVESMSTSTKLNLSIKDTPQSVSVMTSTQIADMGISTYDELLANVAGVTLNRWDERIEANARGFTIDYYKIDGVPTYEQWNSREIDLSIYERVEIVRGANGLTTGIGNPAMSINLVRKKADSKELERDLTLEIDSEGSYGATADIATKLNKDGSVRGRFVLKHEDAESYMNGYTKENDILYVAVDTDISDDTKISTGFSYEKNRKDGVRWGGLPAFYTDGTRTDFDRSLIVSEDWTYTDTQTTSIFADLEHYLNSDSILNVSYSFAEINEKSKLFYIAGAVDKTSTTGNTYYTWNQDKTEENQNLDLSVNIPYKAGSLSNEVVIGTSFNRNDTTNYDGVFGGGSVSSFYNYDVAEPTTLSVYEKPSKIDQLGVYFTNKTIISDTQKLITGARITNYEYTSTDSSISDRTYNGEFTPYVGYVYDLTKETSLYTSYTNIFNPQTNKGADGNYLDPVYGNTFEIGTKGEYFDKALSTSFTLFKTVQENSAEAIDGVKVGGDQAYSAEDVTSKGFEFEASGKVSDAMTLDFGIANFNAKKADGSNYNTKASRTTANLFGKYKFNKELTFGGGIDYNSKIYAEDSTYGTITQDAYYILNAMVSYDVSKDIKTQLNIANLLDEKYYEGVGSNAMVYGSPRTVTANLKYSF